MKNKHGIPILPDKPSDLVECQRCLKFIPQEEARYNGLCSPTDAFCRDCDEEMTQERTDMEAEINHIFYTTR